MQTGSNDVQLRMLIQSARQFLQQGRLDESARLWADVLAMAPANAEALLRLGQHRYFKRDFAMALDYFRRAEAADPADVNCPMGLAFTCRAINDPTGEMSALTRALAIDPHFLPALLSRGDLLQRLGQSREAARVFAMAVAAAPPDDRLSPEILAALSKAREATAANIATLQTYVERRLGALRARHVNEKLSRFDECRDIMLGLKKAFTQEPSLLHIPQLPAITFYDREMFPWLETLEAATDDIRREARVVLDEDSQNFTPYVSHPEGAPIYQWAELNHSSRWRTYFHWKDGKRLEDQCRRCPVTAAIGESLPVIDIPDFGPTIMYSVLAPRTTIPPHSSVTNARLVVHLPLIVPEGCRFRVGNDTRPWREGEAWVFDDTINHEAWNDSDAYRVILMIDVWNPFLSGAERELVGELLNTVRDYYAGETVDTITGLPA